MYTNKITVLYRKKIIDLTTLSSSELKHLRTAINLDMADVEDQIKEARTEYAEHGTVYNAGWMRGAITAARIKHDDIDKISTILQALSTQPNTRLLAAIDVLIEQMDEILDPEDGYHSQLFGQAEYIQRLVEDKNHETI